LKPIYNIGEQYLQKARCVVRGDKQQASIDYDPNSIYAPVASHEGLRLILAIAAHRNLILEGGDIANAYLYGTLDVLVIIQQLTNSSGVLMYPSMDCMLTKSMYDLNRLGRYGFSLIRHFTQLGFQGIYV